MSALIPQSSSKRILYLTDKFGVSDGYQRAFTAMLAKAGIRKQQIWLANIYTLVPSPLIRKGNEKTWKFNPEKLDAITAAFNQKITAISPDIIVVSDPAVLGVLVDGDSRLATLDKLRGGVYQYRGIPVIVTYPITAINTHVDEQLLRDFDGDTIGNEYEPYKVKQGNWILQRDWEKVGRILHGVDFRIPKFEYSVCRTISDCAAAQRWLDSCFLISCDIETGCWPAQITCIGFTGIKPNGATRSFVIPFVHQFKDGGCFWDSESDHLMAWEIVRRILNNPIPKTMHNGFYDASYFIKYQLGITAWLWDSMILWWSAYMELPKTLDFVSSILLDDFQYWKDDIKGIEDEKVSGSQSIEAYWRYNAVDCHSTLFNTLRLLAIIPANPAMSNAYRDAFTRNMSGLKMSMAGIRADMRKRDQLEEVLTRDRDKAVAEFQFCIDDRDFNINSSAQKCSLFYDVLGARERNAKGRPVSDKRGDSRSSGKIPLKNIKTEHPFFGYLVKKLETAMEPDKQISNVMGIKLQTSRFRSAFNAIGTNSTRFSSKKSNFWDGGNAQNIREAYRSWLVADEGCVLVDVDYSQSDDVFIGYEANDAAKIQVIESGVDGHAVHGELFFKVPYDEIAKGKNAKDPRIVHPTTGIRQIAKRVVHGTNFQMAALTLYMTMGRDAVVAAAKYLGHSDAESWSQDRLVFICGQMMTAYRRKYPRLTKKEWYADIYNQLATSGKIVNAFNISRRFLGSPDDNGTQREATGFIGQSDTAGNMNRSMYEIDWGWMPKVFRDGPNPDYGDRPRQMDWESHGFRFLLQIHDSFVCQLDTRHPRWKEAVSNLLYVMNRPVIINGHTVRIKTEAAMGNAWSKSMASIDPRDPHSLDRIVAKL